MIEVERVESQHKTFLVHVKYDVFGFLPANPSPPEIRPPGPFDYDDARAQKLEGETLGWAACRAFMADGKMDTRALLQAEIDKLP